MYCLDGVSSVRLKGGLGGERRDGVVEGPSVELCDAALVACERVEMQT